MHSISVSAWVLEWVVTDLISRVNLFLVLNDLIRNPNLLNNVYFMHDFRHVITQKVRTLACSNSLTVVEVILPLILWKGIIESLSPLKYIATLKIGSLVERSAIRIVTNHLGNADWSAWSQKWLTASLWTVALSTEYLGWLCSFWKNQRISLSCRKDVVVSYTLRNRWLLLYWMRRQLTCSLKLSNVWGPRSWFLENSASFECCLAILLCVKNGLHCWFVSFLRKLFDQL